MIRVLECFAGIGACSRALERLGIEHEIVDAVEIDKYAVKAFNAIHGTNFEPQDITKWDKDIECNLIMHGSPCQDFSVAGLGKGGDEGSGTRSSLMYETLRIVEKLKPKYVIWENVKNLLSKKHRHNFDAYLEAMEKLGYENHYQVLNAKDYGIPQNRERVFTVSILGGGDFEFPEPIPLEKRLKDMLEDNVDEKYYLTDKTLKTFQRNFGSKGKEVELDSVTPTLTASMGTGGGNMPILKVVGELDIKGQDQIKRVYDKDGLSPTLTTMEGGNRQPKVIEQKEISNTVRAGGRGSVDRHSWDLVSGDNYRIRKLTPAECYLLMGFDKEDAEKVSKVISNSQMYKTAGNSIVVNVLEAIFKNLLQ